MDDVELMRRVLLDDPRAFEALYDRHAPAALGVALRVVRRRPAAEDVTQEAFLSAWRSRCTYDAQRSAPRTWLLTITHHRAIDAIRCRRDHLDAPLEADVRERLAPDRTEDEVLRRESAATMRDALGGLPDAQRIVLERAYFGGLTHVEIAAELGLPLGTVKGRVRLALARLALVLA